MRIKELKPRHDPTEQKGRSAARRLMAGTTVALSMMGASAEAKTAKPETPVKTDRGATLRIKHQILNHQPVGIEPRYNVNQAVPNPQDPDHPLSCPVLRPLKMSVSGESHYFVAKQTNLEKPTLRTLKIVPLGGADEVDRVRNSENYYDYRYGTSTSPKAKIVLDKYGVPGTWARYEAGKKPDLQDQDVNGKRHFVNLGYMAMCGAEDPQAMADAPELKP